MECFNKVAASKDIMLTTVAKEGFITIWSFGKDFQDNLKHIIIQELFASYVNPIIISNIIE